MAQEREFAPRGGSKIRGAVDDDVAGDEHSSHSNEGRSRPICIGLDGLALRGAADLVTRSYC